MDENELSNKIIGAAIEVHKHLGPGLLESAYEGPLAYELNLRGISFQRQVVLPVVYKDMEPNCDYRLDFLVENNKCSNEKFSSISIRYIPTYMHDHHIHLISKHLQNHLQNYFLDHLLHL